jgi:hypothetical protein
VDRIEVEDLVRDRRGKAKREEWAKGRKKSMPCSNRRERCRKRRGEERKKEHPVSYVELSRYSVIHIMKIMT